MSDSADLALAHCLANQADAIARRHFSAVGLTVRVKSDGSPVTDADRDIEHALRSMIHAAAP